MTTRAPSVALRTDPSSPPIVEQLQDQGLRLAMDPLERMHLQQDLDALNRLSTRGVLLIPESVQARKRLIETIRRHAQPIPEVQP